jgi:hypothetical protein
MVKTSVKTERFFQLLQTILFFIILEKMLWMIGTRVNTCLIAWITSQVFRNYFELLWIIRYYFELREFLIFSLTELLIFQLGYLSGFLVFPFFIFKNYWIIIYFSAGLLIFLLGFWQLNCSELLWIAVNRGGSSLLTCLTSVRTKEISRVFYNSPLLRQ